MDAPQCVTLPLPCTRTKIIIYTANQKLAYSNRDTLPSVAAFKNVILPLPCTRPKKILTRTPEKLPSGIRDTLPSVDKPQNDILPLPCTRLKKNIYTENKKKNLQQLGHLALRGFTPKRYSPVTVYPMTENIIYTENQEIATLDSSWGTLPSVDAPQSVILPLPCTRPVYPFFCFLCKYFFSVGYTATEE